MTFRLAHRLFVISILTAPLGCGDDAGGADPTAGDDSTGGTMGALTSGSTGPGPGPGTESGGPTQDDTSGTTAPSEESTDSGTGGTAETDTGSSDASGSSDTGEASSSSDDGMTIPGCEMCGDDEVCVVNQAFANEYVCQPMPAACEGDVDCECGSELCVDPFVGCFDPPESSTLFCACIAC